MLALLTRFPWVSLTWDGREFHLRVRDGGQIYTVRARRLAELERKTLRLLSAVSNPNSGRRKGHAREHRRVA